MLAFFLDAAQEPKLQKTPDAILYRRAFFIFFWVLCVGVFSAVWFALATVESSVVTDEVSSSCPLRIPPTTLSTLSPPNSYTSATSGEMKFTSRAECESSISVSPASATAGPFIYTDCQRDLNNGGFVCFTSTLLTWDVTTTAGTVKYHLKQNYLDFSFTGTIPGGGTQGDSLSFFLTSQNTTTACIQWRDPANTRQCLARSTVPSVSASAICSGLLGSQLPQACSVTIYNSWLDIVTLTQANVSTAMDAAIAVSIALWAWSQSDTEADIREHGDKSKGDATAGETSEPRRTTYVTELGGATPIYAEDAPTPAPGGQGRGRPAGTEREAELPGTIRQASEVEMDPV